MCSAELAVGFSELGEEVMPSMMGRLQGVELDDVPECTVAIVSAGNDLPELDALLRGLAEKAAAAVLWCLDESAKPSSTLQRMLEDSPFCVRQLTNGDALRRGFLHLVVGRQRVWFEGRTVRLEPLLEPERRPVDEFLVSLAKCWGERSIVVLSPCDDGDGEDGLGRVRAAGGFGLTLDESRAMAARFNPASSAVFPTQRRFAFGKSMLGVVQAAARAAVANTCQLGRMRVWLPDCKTGNLAYAMAMLLSDAAAGSKAPLKLQIFGTDPDEGALAIARAGRYPARAALDMDPSLRARYTLDEGETIRVSEALREICVFSSHSLSRDPPLSRMDLIVCHRVFDGLAPARTREIIDALHFSLRGEGLLLPLDHAELFPDDRFELTKEGYLRARPLRAKHIQRKTPPLHGPASPGTIDERRLVQNVRREQALADAVRARADLESFVHSVGVPILFCDHQLRLLDMSTAACRMFGLSDANRDATLATILHRLPGGGEIVRTAACTISEQMAQRLTIRTPQHAYLVHFSPVQRLTQPGVSISFTDVSELDAAQARAVAQQHQQAAVARVGNLALSVTDEKELFEEALGVLFGNISVCVAGVILEKMAEDHELAVLASRGLGDSPLRLLRDMGEPAQMLEAVLERESPVMHPDLEITGARPRPASAEAPTSKPRSAPFHSALTFVKAGLACPIVNEGSVLGVIALYSRQEGLEAIEHQHFVQAVANVLGAAIVRHRTRRRLALEVEASSVLASAADTAAAGNGIEHALRLALAADEIELWGSEPSAQTEWVRLFPETAEMIPLPASLQPFSRADGPGRQPRSFPITTTEGLREIVVPARRRDRTTALLRLSGTKLRAPDRELCDGLERIGFMLADFLDRQQIHAALARSEASYRQSSAEFEALYASLPVGVSIHERNGAIRRINGHLERLQAAGGEGGSRALDQLYSKEAPPWIARVVASGEPIQDVELSTSNAGDPRSWLCNFAPIRDLDGTVLGASAVLQDITALKHVEASLREAAQQKDDFLAILGHELRNPIAAIRNATELLSRVDHASPQLLRLQSIFDRQTLQTTKLIDGLLDVARVARGKVELQLAAVHVVELVQQVVDDRRHQFGSRSVDVRLPAEDLWVAADRVRLVQILDNLLSNALKFTAPAGNVVIDVQRKGRGGRVHVSDDGIGIEPELLPEIFEPFRQGRAATRGGLGLGLALVKGLVDLHGFTLEVQSAGVGQGAAFEIEFPLAAAPVELAPESRLDTRPLSLLLIEDNTDIAETLAELLTDAGHEIQIAGSAEDALAALQVGSPDIVLCDIGLPGMDGLTLAQQLRDDPGFRDLKLVAMTGYGDASTRACIERAGFDRYLIKPVQLDALQHCLMRLAAAPAQWINRR